MSKRKVEVYNRVRTDSGLQNILMGVATFHEWGSDYEEFDNGGCTFSTAIIEWSDGKVDNIPVHLIKFITEDV